MAYGNGLPPGLEVEYYRLNLMPTPAPFRYCLVCHHVHIPDITHDNLQLIKSLKDEIAEMKDYERTNLQRMKSLTLGNQNLAEPLKQKEQTRQELQNQLKS